MGAVADFVEDTVGGVIDAVGDVVESVAHVVDKVVETVGNVVQAVIDDPVPVLLSVAGSFVGIPPAITMGAITAARGGDLEDVALSMGTAYFAPTVGGAISSTVTETFIEAGMNETFSQVASNSISKGLVNGTIAEIKGQSFEDGFAGGLTGGLVAGGVGEIGSYVKDDVIQLAQESGLDLKDATSLYNAGARAVSAGVTSEVTGKGTFATSFANSAVNSTIDAGTRSLNSTIDEQFRTAATDWNEKDTEGTPVEVAITGAGIPNDVVSQVQVSDIGVDNTPEMVSAESVLADTTKPVDKTTNVVDEATSDISVLPETKLAQAPTAETDADFADLIGAQTPIGGNAAVTGGADEVPESVIDIADSLPTDASVVASAEPTGGLTALAETPVGELTDPTAPAVVSEAPVSDNLLTSGLAQDKPEGGLNAVAQTPQVTAEDKMASSMGLKPTDITKPVVATVGNLLKSTLKVGNKPPARAVAKRPAGALSTMAGVAKPTVAPPTKVDVAKLFPIKKATSTMPAKTLSSAAKLSPVTNIAGLTSLLKKAG